MFNYKTMKEIYRTDIEDKKEFTFEGDLLQMDYCADPEKHIYVFKRFHNNYLMGYEVIKGKKHTNPDGSVIYVYPSSDDFGKCGYFVSAQWANSKKGIAYYVNELAAKGSKTGNINTIS